MAIDEECADFGDGLWGGGGGLGGLVEEKRKEERRREGERRKISIVGIGSV